MPKSVPLIVRIRIICTNRPPNECGGQPTRFGLQDKNGILLEGLPNADGALVYECDLRAKPGAGDSVNFLGSYAHGTPTARFLYLSWAYANGTAPVWIKRFKVPLNAILWKQVEEATQEKRVLETQVDARRTGMVAPIGGWQIRDF
jgi:uncharacterized protein DUF5990